MDILVLQHIACEPPGLYEEILLERGARIHCVERDEGEPLPRSFELFDAILAMGGPTGVNDEATYPWMREEKAFISRAVRAGVPYWGTCLGVQLLAASLGARVYPGPHAEVGLLPITLTEDALEDPVFRDLPGQLFTVQFHGDTFQLPDGAVLLASSPAYPHQAFRWRQAYGFQFHLEASSAMVRDWLAVPGYISYLGLDAAIGSRLLCDIEAHAQELRAHGRRMFEQWLDLTLAARRR
ncbi:MAG TPA: type 1 glutamine amidotransferase [Candidatus Dormibacteraeota bacterium]